MLFGSTAPPCPPLLLLSLPTTTTTTSTTAATPTPPGRGKLAGGVNVHRSAGEERRGGRSCVRCVWLRGAAPPLCVPLRSGQQTQLPATLTAALSGLLETGEGAASATPPGDVGVGKRNAWWFAGTPMGPRWVRTGATPLTAPPAAAHARFPVGVGVGVAADVTTGALTGHKDISGRLDVGQRVRSLADAA